MSLQGIHAHKVHNFYTYKTIRYSRLCDIHKFTANIRDEDHEITQIHYFVA